MAFGANDPSESLSHVIRAAKIAVQTRFMAPASTIIAIIGAQQPTHPAP